MPLFTQTRQGLEKKVMSEEYENLLLWGLWTWLGLKEQLLGKGHKNTAMNPWPPWWSSRICECRVS
jgi:hypothetical protein